MPNILLSNTFCLSPTYQKKEFLLKKQSISPSSCSYINNFWSSHPSQCLIVIYAGLFTQLRLWEGTRQSLQPHVVSNLVCKTDSKKTCNVRSRSKDTRKKTEQIKRVGEGSAPIFRDGILEKRHKLSAIWGNGALKDDSCHKTDSPRLTLTQKA